MGRMEMIRFPPLSGAENTYKIISNGIAGCTPFAFEIHRGLVLFLLACYHVLAGDWHDRLQIKRPQAKTQHSSSYVRRVCDCNDCLGIFGKAPTLRELKSGCRQVYLKDITGIECP
jgi:hypothetical protein